MHLRQSMAVLLVSLLASVTSCGLCDDTQKSKAVSPDGQLVASVFERNCGATVDFSSIVSLASTSAPSLGMDDFLFTAKGRHDISARWSGPNSLVITCSDCPREDIYRQLIVDGRTDVTYILGSTARTGER
jgi:hypothetical protein